VALNKGIKYIKQMGLVGSSDMLFTLDSDTYPISFFNYDSLVTKSAVVSITQRRKSAVYVYPNFAIFDFARFDAAYEEFFHDIDFRPGNGTDTGGRTWPFLKKHNFVLGSDITLRGCGWSSDFPLEVKSIMDDICAIPLPATSCAESEFIQLNSVYFVHLGSASSNWRNCSKLYLNAKRKMLYFHLLSRMHSF